MARKPKWTEKDQAALLLLVERHGAAEVRKRLKSFGRGRGHPPGNSGDMIPIWEAVEALMRRDGILKHAACNRIAEAAQQAFGPNVKGYGESMLAKLHTAAEEYFKDMPEMRASSEAAVADWVEENRNRPDVIRLPIRTEAFLQKLEERQGKEAAEQARKVFSLMRQDSDFAISASNILGIRVVDHRKKIAD